MGVGMRYPELVCYSNFTFQVGASHPQELIHRAKELGYSAIAITDECSLAGIVRAHDAAKEAGIKLIVGSRFNLAEGDAVVLLAPTQAAYTQLCQLITNAKREAKKGTYEITRENFRRGLEHCIGLWIPGRAVHEMHARWFASLPFSHSALTFTDTLAQNDERRLQALQTLSRTLEIPLAAVGDVHYHERGRRHLHDVLTAIRLKTTVDGIGRAALANGERHLRPLSALSRIYPPQLLASAADIAERCTFSLSSLHYEYPEELVPSGRAAIVHLRRLTEDGVKRRWPQGVDAQVLTLIDRELRLIEELRFEHFFLTVEELVSFARSKGILCQGRGSAANSAVCYALGITEVDPGRVSLLFERFISKERHEPPDIDVDFENVRREEVIQHVFEKYGRHRAAIAATVITYRLKMAIRDVGKALGLPLDVLGALSKSILWFDSGDEVPRQMLKLGLDPQSPVIHNLIRLVNEILGFPRHLSQHVGGFVISQNPLSTLVPVEPASMDDRTIIQWDKEDLESLGLLKVDCLALGMMTALQKALQLKSRFDGTRFRLQDIPAEDPATYDMLCKAESVGVFQVESRAQMTMLPRLKPRNYFDLVVQIAIIRPGPIQGGMVHPYLRRRAGLEQVSYPNPDIAKVLQQTFGVPLFQEQVMQIAMVAAGFSAGEADKVRRSMAAWQRRGGLSQFRDRLKAGMLERGYTEGFADQIYHQILGFGSYGFPMSHAASFALIAYATAWMRCHEPAPFVAGLLNSQPMGFYQPAQLIYDAKRNGVCFRPIDVTASEWECTLERGEDEQPLVRLGFILVDGLKAESCRTLIQCREDRPFQSLDDLAHRARLSRREMGILAAAGALYELAGHRRQAHWHSIGIERLPYLLAEASAPDTAIRLPAPTEAQDITFDYQSMGFTLGRHPLSLLRPKLNAFGVHNNQSLGKLKPGVYIRVAGLVISRQRPETASELLFMSIEDESGITNIIVRKDVQAAQRGSVFGSRMVVVAGKLQNELGVIHVVAEHVDDYTAWLGKLPSESRDFH